MKVEFFTSPGEFRKWLAKHHGTERELWVGYYKKGTGRENMTWQESVDEALCFGWIDGLKKSVDEVSYAIRFTPRRTKSTWSAVNIKRVGELIEEGRMRPAGRRAFEARVENRSGIYSYEQRSAELPEPYAGSLRQNKKAAAFFEAQTPSYRKAVSWWVVSAKREETRRKRLAQLIDDSAHGRTIRQFTPIKKTK